MSVEKGIFDDYTGMILGSPPYSDPQPKKKRRRHRNSGMNRMEYMRFRVFQRDKFTCRDCLRVFEAPKPYKGQMIEGLTLGHIVARSKGGAFKVGNLIAQCQPCNHALGDRLWIPHWQDIYPKNPNEQPPEFQMPNWML